MTLASRVVRERRRRHVRRVRRVAVAAVLAGWLAGYVGSRALAWAGRIVLAAAGVGVAYFVLR